MYKPGARAAAERTCGWRVGRRNCGGTPRAVAAAAVATTDPRSPEYDGSAIAGGGSGVESGNRAESRLLDGFFVLAQSVWAICRYRLVLPPRAHPRAGVVPRTRHPWATLTNGVRVGSVPSPCLEVWCPRNTWLCSTENLSTPPPVKKCFPARRYGRWHTHSGFKRQHRGCRPVLCASLRAWLAGAATHTKCSG